ncbi:tetratricopeptide repeat protein [Candidatus Woesearchaeota archaeon]|nr:tetratricopeptide repeat protein [Candidatus Woesearchaeota archaeon]
MAEAPKDGSNGKTKDGHISRVLATVEQEQAEMIVAMDSLKQSMSKYGGKTEEAGEEGAEEEKEEVILTKEENEKILAEAQGYLETAYSKLKKFAEPHADLISYPSGSNMDYVAQTISKRTRSLHELISSGGKADAIQRLRARRDGLVKEFNDNLLLASEAAKAYKILTEDNIRRESLLLNAQVDPAITSLMKGWLHELIINSHPDLRRMITETLVEYRRGIGLSADKTRDNYDIWTRILADIRGKDSRLSYAFGYAKALFERAGSSDRVDLAHHPTQFSNTINTLGGLLTKIGEAAYTSATEFGLEAANLRSSTLADKLGGGEKVITTREDIKEFIDLEQGVLTRLGDLLFSAVRGTSLEGKLRDDLFQTPSVKNAGTEYLAARSHTFTSQGPQAALHKDIAYLASTPDIKDRARIAEDLINKGFKGSYRELSGREGSETETSKKKGPYEELDELRKRGGLGHDGFNAEVIPYPTFKELEKAIDNIVRNPDHEVVRHAHFQASRLFEALGAYRLYGDITELSLVAPKLSAPDAEPTEDQLREAGDRRRALAAAIKQEVGGLYRKLQNTEDELSTFGEEGLKFSYLTKRKMFEIVDGIVAEPHQDKVQKLNSRLARIYEVLRMYDVLLNSRKGTSALKEEVAEEKRVINFDKDALAIYVRNAQDPLQTLIREEFIDHRKLLDKRQGMSRDMTDDQYFEAAKFDMSNDRLLIGYAARFYRADMRSYRALIDGSSEAITRLEEFGRRLLRLYSSVSSLAKALHLKSPEMDDSKAIELLAKYNNDTGRVGNVFEFTGKRKAELESFLNLEVGILNQISELVPQLFNGMSDAGYLDYPHDDKLMEKARGFSEQGKYDQAVELLDMVLMRMPNDPWVYYEKGRIQLRLGKADEAIESFKLAVEDNPNTKTYHALAHALVKRKNPEDIDSARKLAQIAVDLDSKNTDARDLLEALGGRVPTTGGEGKDFTGVEALYTTATDLLKTGNVDDAIARYDEIIAKNPDYTWAHYDRGIAYLRKADYKESAASLGKAAELEPNDANIRSDLASVYEKLGNVKEARAHAEKALELEPGNSAAQSLLETLDRKISAFSDIYDKHGNDDEIQAAGSELLAGGDFDGAIRHYDAILARAPNASAHYDKAHALLKKGEYKEAIDSFRKAAQLMPGTSWIHSDLAIAYEKLGLPKAAKSQAELTLQLDPKDEGAQGVLERISE